MISEDRDRITPNQRTSIGTWPNLVLALAGVVPVALQHSWTGRTIEHNVYRACSLGIAGYLIIVAWRQLDRYQSLKLAFSSALIGGLGMQVGHSLDIYFGQPSHHHCCLINSWQQLGELLTGWSTLLMLVGCISSCEVMTRLANIRQSYWQRSLCHTSCITFMLLGMISSEVILEIVVPSVARSPTASHIAMVLGMAAGSWLGYLICPLVSRCGHGSQHAPPKMCS